MAATPPTSPDLGAIEADGLVAAAQRVIDQVRQLMR